MNQLDTLGAASNEQRQQNIMMLRRNFDDEKYNSIADAAASTGYQPETIRKWAIDGDIPLLNNRQSPVVPITHENARHINSKTQSAHISELCELFYDQHATTVTACSQHMAYPAQTIISWAKEGDVPLITADGSPIVPLNDTNTPVWYDDPQSLD